MKTKPDDIPYCGVDEDKIKNANPTLNEEVLRYHRQYIYERHNIYKRKEIYKLPQEEWTEDEVFKNYRFTNVRRELDRESKWLIKNVSENPNLTLEEKVLWSILFRTFNKSKTLEKLNFPGDFDILNFTKEDMEKIREIIKEENEKDPKFVWFTPAFNTGGIRATWCFPKQRYYECTSSEIEVEVYNSEEIKKMKLKEAKEFIKENPDWKIKDYEYDMRMRMLELVKWARDNNIHQRVSSTSSQEEAYEILKEIPGFSKFLAYQVFVDLTYIPEYKFSENEFTVSGPGCDRGLDLLFDDKDGMNYEEALFWVRDNIEKEWDKRGLSVDFNELFDHLPEYDRCLNVMMCENSFCELGKYTSARRGTGRPRNRYVPTEEPEVCDNECSISEWL